MKAKNQVILALAASFVLFFLTMGVTNFTAERRLRGEAYKFAGEELKYHSSVTNVLFMSAEWAINTFLAAYADMDYTPSGDGSTFIVNHFVRSGSLKNFHEPDVVSSMTSLLSYYDCLSTASLIIKPGVLPACPEGYALMLEKPGFEKCNLLEHDDVFSSELFMSSQELSAYKVGRIFEGREKEWIYAVPLLGSDSQLIGEFWASMSLEYIDHFLDQYKTGDELVIGIVDSEGTVVSLNNSKYHCESLEEALKNEFGGDWDKYWTESLRDRLKDKEASRFDSDFEGVGSRSYICPVSGTPFYFVSVKSVERILKSVHRIMAYLFSLATISVIVFAFFLIFTFRRYRKENEVIQRMEGELDIASRIQRRILPENPSPDGIRFPENLDIFGYQSCAKSVGGDLYDYLVIDDRLFFCIGDVSGNGVPAALLMSEICSLFRYMAKHITDPQEIVRALNGSAMDSSEDRMICTMFVGILDLGTGMLEYCNAAHNPPITISDGSARYIRMKANLPLFAYDDYPYKKEFLQLSKGDRLFLYTDGLTEAKDKDDNFFGTGRTLEMVGSLGGASLQNIVSEIRERISEFSGDEGQYDDVTMLVIDYKI